MANNLRGACDGILQKVVTGKPRVPGDPKSRNARGQRLG
jgi:hypothetical protein